jgi:hypothetical protein
MNKSMAEIKLKVNLRIKAVELALRYADVDATTEEILSVAEKIYRFSLIEAKDVTDKP